MRMRHKPWADAILADCPFYTPEPTQFRGKWQAQYEKTRPLHLELGCGKGSFLSAIAARNPDVNYLGVDIKSAVLGSSVKNAYETFGEKVTPGNLWICAWDIERIDEFIAPQEGVERIYINFCNPWPKQRHHKKRLTHTTQLAKYKQFMPQGQIHFKTDDAPLFLSSLRYFDEAGMEVIYKTDDLHASDYPNNIMTEHEAMYLAEGKKIHFAIVNV